MRLLLTGGAGFIGDHLFRELSSNGHTVDIFDKKLGDEYDILTENGIDNFKQWLKNYSYDIIVHLAAQVGRAFGEDDIGHTINSNVNMTARVIRSLSSERFLYVSTSEIYGDLGDEIAYENTSKKLCHNAYGLTKRHGEEISALYMPKGGLQVVRPSMPYGPGLPFGRGRAAIINMLWQSSVNMDIPVHRDAERSWCWIGDTVAGFRKIIEEGEIAHSAKEYEQGIGCYNLGNDSEPVTMFKVAMLACSITGGDMDNIKLMDAPSNQTVVKRLSMDKLRSLGWKPTIDLRTGMEKTYEEIKDEWQGESQLASISN